MTAVKAKRKIFRLALLIESRLSARPRRPAPDPSAEYAGMTTAPRLCKDCKWIRPRDEKQPLCGHPTSVAPATTSLVTGELRPAYQYTCADMRGFLAWDTYCGAEGLHWEAADGTPGGFP